MLKTTRPHSWPIAVPARLAWLVALSALLGGCTGSDWQPPTVMLATSVGATTIYAPAAARPADDVLPGPPAGLANAASAAGPPAGHDGDYAGWADPFVTDGGLCGQTLRIEGFHVLGDRVSFGRQRLADRSVLWRNIPRPAHDVCHPQQACLQLHREAGAGRGLTAGWSVRAPAPRGGRLLPRVKPRGPLCSSQ
jgi:hypothetical protein